MDIHKIFSYHQPGYLVRDILRISNFEYLTDIQSRSSSGYQSYGYLKQSGGEYLAVGYPVDIQVRISYG